ncbi:FAD-binding protein [Proteiniclasticum ruminis]|uniref:FAD-binding protein n=2 Tax=Proteiniclasticum ruminis TaxID=398199 RepID=UPI0028ACF839|nr:FAD-binding protein [Proteiniclasticum ruminis]
MERSQMEETDVLVIGSGIAGLSAALYSAMGGVKVTLATAVHLFSGSTFFPGTWGFGLVGPESEEDEEEFIKTILSLGKGVALPSLVRTFVEKVNGSVDELEAMGLTLLKPSSEKEGEKEYIPCFDHKHRRWRGLTKKNLLEVMPGLLAKHGVTIRPFHKALELTKDNERISGAFFIKEGKELVHIRAKAVILATGGLSGLYKYRLTTDDVTGTGVGMALRAGAKTVNLEFLQKMIGFVTPGPKTVHNEKTFEASNFYTGSGEDLLKKRLPEGISKEEVLKLRALHGPFSTETDSKYLDLALHEELQESGQKGVLLRYDAEKVKAQGEFVKTYFDWLKEEKGVSMDEDIHVAPYMHASNGGLLIDEKARTSLEGLYAAGECTGGMHGADRVGGLSTANGIVFGKIAGIEAASYSRKRGYQSGNQEELKNLKVSSKTGRKELQDALYAHAFLSVTEESIEKAERVLDKITFTTEESSTAKELEDAYSLLNEKAAAAVLLQSIIERKESRGSFYRKDYESHRSDFDRPLVGTFSEGKPQASFYSEGEVTSW